MFAAVVLLDLIGGQIAVRAYNRGVVPGAGRDLFNGAAFAAAAVAMASYLGPLIPVPRSQAEDYYYYAPNDGPPMQRHIVVE
jgi:hypothetical protein